MTVAPESVEFLRLAARAADEKKAENIQAFDVSETMAITDAFMVASAPNERQVHAIIDAIEDALREEYSLTPLRREGRSQSRWVLLDYGDVVIHILHDEDRAFYALERLWGDNPSIDLQIPEHEASA